MWVVEKNEKGVHLILDFYLEQARISTVSEYEKAEKIAIDYVETLGYPAGYLDWAIWATMKAAREIGLVETLNSGY